MSDEDRQGLVKKPILTNVEVRAIEQLATLVNEHDHLYMRLPLGELQQRTGDATYNFLYYEDGILVGYLSVDRFAVKRKEVTGMIHPDHRRKGIFRALLDAAKEEWIPRGVQKLILVCEDASPAGLAFAEAVGASYDSAEHEMVLGTFHERQTFDERLIFRRARADELDAIVAIQAEDDHDDVERIKSFLEKILEEPRRAFYLGLFGDKDLGCEEPVGCIRLDEMEDETSIYGFVVRRDYRGRGYGRQMLEESIRLLRSKSQKPIMLEVDTNNTNALGLYRSVGFEVETTYDYYILDL